MDSLLIIALCVVVILALVIFLICHSSPKAVVFLYIACWLFFPHGMRSFGDLFRLDTQIYSYYFFLKSSIALALFLILLTKSNLFQHDYIIRDLITWMRVLILGTTCAVIFYSILGPSEKYSTLFVKENVGIYSIIDLACNIIFLAGMVKFFRSFKDIENIFFLFVIASIVTMIDYIFLYQFELVNQLTHITKGVHGRYLGIIQNDYVSMGRFLAISIVANIFYGIKLNQRRYFLVSILFLYISFTTYQRTNILMAVFTFVPCCFIWIKKSGSKYQSLPVIILTIVALGIVTVVAIVAFYSPLGFYINARQESLFDPKELYARLSLFGAGLQCFRDNIFFGVGPGESEYAMYYYTSFLFYQERVKSIHNMYLVFITEFGIIGILILGWWMSLYTRLWRYQMKYLSGQKLNKMCKIAIWFSFIILGAIALGYLTDGHYNWFVFMLVTSLPFLAVRSSLNYKLLQEYKLR